MKISRKQVEEYNLPTIKKFLGLEVANYYIEKMENSEVMYIIKMKIPLFAVLFIPVHAFIFLMCVWDGGIKEFRFCDNEITSERINKLFMKSDKWSALVDLIDNGNKMFTEEEHDGY